MDNKARVQIINDYFDLLASLAAHGKSNGLGGLKLSRFGGWWAFEHYDTGKGFDAGYRLWNNAATATSHLFFAYLRSQTPEPGSTNGILDLPRSLQQLVDSVDYPPHSGMIANDTTKVVMIVDVVSPTPFALLRRAKQFEYRDDDMALRHFAEFEDPVGALTEECRRVLRAISTTNQSHVSDAATSTSLKDPSWSRFEDIGFGNTFDDSADGMFSPSRSSTAQGLNSSARSPVTDLNRPTTPSWADFLSSGFADEDGNRTTAPILLPPDKALPPMSTMPRGQSSQSHRRDIDTRHLEPGELASINKVDLDDAFWWVWISSLAGEEPVARKAAFGRCALVETSLLGGQWMVMEEQVKGAAPEPVPGAYVAERKSFFSFTKKGRLTRRRSAIKKSPLADNTKDYDPSNRLTLDQDRQARIQKAAAELAQKKQREEAETIKQRRGRTDENANVKTTSVFTLGPLIKDEASPALQWAKQYDKKTIRQQYLGNTLAGKGSSDFLTLPPGGLSVKRSTSTISSTKDLPPTPEAPEYLASPAQEKADGFYTAAQTPLEAPAQKFEPAVESPRYQASPALVEAPPIHPPAPLENSSVQTHTRPAIPEKTPSVTDLTSYQSKQSQESKRSIKSRGSDKEKPQTERGRLKKLGFNAPPPVATNKNSGVKKMFGTFRKHKDNQLPPESKANEDPAIAAARRALEGKPARPGDGPASPPLSPNHFAKFQNAAKKPSEVAATSETSNAPEAPDRVEEPAQAQVIERNPVPEAEVPYQTNEGERNHVRSQPDQHDLNHEDERHHVKSHPVQHDLTVQQPRRHDEFEDLSQVDSHERAHAAHEFSRFDQGPLIDQPAFVPTEPDADEDYGRDEAPAFEPPHRPQHQSVYSAVTMQTEATDEDDQADAMAQMSAHDRWAQIRRNAAERAARASEDHGRSRTETRTTDDGETSGEESR